MNTNQIQGNFKQLKGKILQNWSKLNENDIGGNWNELAGKIQERYGLVKEEVQKQINDLIKTAKEKFD